MLHIKQLGVATVAPGARQACKLQPSSRSRADRRLPAAASVTQSNKRLLSAANMARRAPLAAGLLASALLVGCAGAVLLTRPEQDCINPSVGKINEFNFYPEDYRSIISEPAHAAPGATVRAGHMYGMPPPARSHTALACCWVLSLAVAAAGGGAVQQARRRTGARCARSCCPVLAAAPVQTPAAAAVLLCSPPRSPTPLTLTSSTMTRTRCVCGGGS